MLTSSQLIKKFPTFYGTHRFISNRHLSLSWASSILTFHVANLLSLFHRLGCTKVSVQDRGTSVCFMTTPVFTVRSCQHLTKPPSWTTPYQLSATAHSIYSQLPSILEAISPSATRGCAMLWWQGPTDHGDALVTGSVYLVWRAGKGMLPCS
jgi:hypothetical protein